jgi:hypothetical protein
MYIRSVIRSRRIKKPQSFSDDHTRQPSKVVRFGVQERVDLIIDLILEMTAIKAVIGYQGADNRPNRLLSFELFHTDLAKLFLLTAMPDTDRGVNLVYASKVQARVVVNQSDACGLFHDRGPNKLVVQGVTI